jgi:hypothetical protein
VSGKKISFGPKPTGKPLPPAADSWVESRTEEAEPVRPSQEKQKPEKMKRLTIDIPLSLHRAIKSQCAIRGTTIADEVREFLLKQYGKS